MCDFFGRFLFKTSSRASEQWREKQRRETKGKKGLKTFAADQYDSTLSINSNKKWYYCGVCVCFFCFCFVAVFNMWEKKHRKNWRRFRFFDENAVLMARCNSTKCKPKRAPRFSFDDEHMAYILWACVCVCVTWIYRARVYSTNSRVFNVYCGNACAACVWSSSTRFEKEKKIHSNTLVRMSFVMTVLLFFSLCFRCLSLVAISVRCARSVSSAQMHVLFSIRCCCCFIVFFSEFLMKPFFSRQKNWANERKGK